MGIFSKKVGKKSYDISTFDPLFIPVSLTKFLSVLGSGDAKLLNYFLKVPELQAVVGYRAKVFSDMVIKARHPETLEEKPLPEVFKYFNPFQNTKTFLAQTSILKDIFGDVFQHIVYGTDKQKAFGIINLPPVNARIETNNILPFNVRSKEDLIKYYEIEYEGKKYQYDPNEIIHLTDHQTGFTKEMLLLGDSKVDALSDLLDNILIAYEARGTVLSNSAIGILANETKDGLGSITDISDKEKKDLQNKYKSKYGLSRDKNQLILTNLNLRFQDMSFDMRKLGLIEGLQQELRVICNAYSFPSEIFETQTTFTNKEQAQIQLYEVAQTEANDYLQKLNEYFEWTDLELYADYSHVKILQGDLEKKTRMWNTATMALNRALTDGAITAEEYRSTLEKIGLL